MVTVAVEPKVTRVLKRGDWLDETGQIVTPATPAFLPPLGVTGRRANRLDLARWLVSGEHPQTGRVFVNRLWYLLLGTAISNTLADNGSQGEWPSHPELLDYLSSEFVTSGWDVKHMVKLIVMSNTYRQASTATADLRERDPENRLFARQARFRLPAEMVRDTALRVSGLLIDRRGGSSARPYQPKGYYAYLNFPKRKYTADANDNQYRRGVYTHWQRQFLHPMLRAFDAPSREECTAKRPTSNTPLAALTLLNDPTFVEAARALATRTMLEGGDDDGQRIAWVWRAAVSREPNPEERRLLKMLLDESRRHYQEAADQAAELGSVGLFRSPAKLDAKDVAAWTSVARAVLNLNETITRN